MFGRSALTLGTAEPHVKTSERQRPGGPGAGTFRPVRSLLLRQIGAPFEVGDLPEPTAAPDEVLVDIAFASVNPLDIWVSQGNIGNAGSNLPWVPGTEATGYLDGRPVLDVLVVGAGMCGQTAAFALQREGIRNLRVIDRESHGREGPWNTTARMPI